MAQRKHKAGYKFSEADKREAFAVAVMGRTEKGYSWKKGAETVGATKTAVSDWAKRSPELFEEVKAQVEAKLEKVAPDLAMLLLENANLAAGEWNNRLKKDPSGIRDFALTGILDYSIKNAQLLQGKPTGNERPVNINFGFGTANLQQGKGKDDSSNRIKKYADG